MPIFECKDVFGEDIICPYDRWQHILDHPEMYGQEGLVKATIEDPDFITQDKYFENRFCNYKKLELPILGVNYIRVIVQKKSKKGIVISAFSCVGSAKGEKLIWKKK